jgi:hypothetical protein
VADVSVTFTTSSPSVGQLVTAATSGASAVATVGAGLSSTPYPVGVAFDPLAIGTTTVSAAAPGFDPSFALASQAVTVTQSEILVGAYYGDPAIGSGLQALHYLSLNGTEHGGVTVRVSSSNPTAIRVSSSETTPGAAFVDLVVPNGTGTVYFWVQGLGPAGGSATLTASHPAFVPGTLSRGVVQPVLLVGNLPSSMSVSSPSNAEFWATAGIATSATSQLPQAAVAAIPVTFSSSAPAVGQLVTPSDTGASVVVSIAAGVASTQYPGGIAFDPLSEGTTTVSVTAPGFNPVFAPASQLVTVTP